MSKIRVKLPAPQPKQELFLRDTHKYVAFGGARGGGKSWAIRMKAVILALAYKGIRICIVRRTYQELRDNHVNPLIKMLPREIYRYNKQENTITFVNGSVIFFRFYATDTDSRGFQGIEYHCIFIDEATQILENHFKEIAASCRGVDDFP